MAKDFPALTRSISHSLRQFRADVPETMKGFDAMAQSATRAGALDHKTKELIALAIGVAAHCDGCIGFHVKALVKAGATKLELEEALGVAVYMGGGPALMYAADALDAWDQFTAAAASAPHVAQPAAA